MSMYRPGPSYEGRRRRLPSHLRDGVCLLIFGKAGEGAILAPSGRTRRQSLRGHALTCRFCKMGQRCPTLRQKWRLGRQRSETHTDLTSSAETPPPTLQQLLELGASRTSRGLGSTSFQHQDRLCPTANRKYYGITVSAFPDCSGHFVTLCEL